VQEELLAKLEKPLHSLKNPNDFLFEAVKANDRTRVVRGNEPQDLGFGTVELFSELENPRMHQSDPRLGQGGLEVSQMALKLIDLEH
jgi:hypothetical protein